MLSCNSKKQKAFFVNKQIKAKSSKFTLTGVKSFLGDACENGQGGFRSKTVGFFRNRYRLGHKWVPEMVLDVQSNLPNTLRVKQGY